MAWAWQDSRLPDSYSVMDMGVVDLGGGAALGHAGHGAGHGGTSLASLTGPRDRAPDARFTLTARRGQLQLAGGERLDGYTLNGTSPGPELRVQQGDLVEVVLENVDVPAGTTLHWHGVDLPNAEDGVAGVTQDAVAPGERHTYRFVAEDAGTYWYHSHQVSHEQVRAGLFGVLVVEPGEATAAQDTDAVFATHTYGGLRTINGRTGVSHLPAGPGSTVRLRMVNTDNGRLRSWVTGGAYRVLAVDARDLHEPTPVQDEQVVVAAGGRVDLELAVPTDGSALRVDIGGGTALVVGPDVDVDERPEPEQVLDLLDYGSPAPLAFDPSDADRDFDYDIGRRPGFLDGRPGFWWTVNGELLPDVPMYMVEEGDVVRMTIRNDSGDVHPMHLHGHHAVVLSRDGVPASGSPWWIDSLDVLDGEEYEIAFVADNPGVWMDHCHNLAHAAEGLLAHLSYAGVTTPYRMGSATGNEPE